MRFKIGMSMKTYTTCIEGMLCNIVVSSVFIRGHHTLFLLGHTFVYTGIITWENDVSRCCVHYTQLTLKCRQAKCKGNESEFKLHLGRPIHAPPRPTHVPDHVIARKHKKALLWKVAEPSAYLGVFQGNYFTTHKGRSIQVIRFIIPALLSLFPCSGKRYKCTAERFISRNSQLMWWQIWIKI